MNFSVPDGVLVDVEHVSGLFERLHTAKHTGCVVLFVHFAQGQVRFIDIPGEVTRISLDSGKKRAQSLT